MTKCDFCDNASVEEYRGNMYCCSCFQEQQEQKKEKLEEIFGFEINQRLLDEIVFRVECGSDYEISLLSDDIEDIRGDVVEECFATNLEESRVIHGDKEVFLWGDVVEECFGTNLEKKGRFIHGDKEVFLSRSVDHVGNERFKVFIEDDDCIKQFLSGRNNMDDARYVYKKAIQFVKTIMGTNYYAQINKCDHCGRSADRVHLGKSSGGWTFTVDISHGEFKDFDSLKRFLHSEEVSEIRNEYGEEISEDEFFDIVLERNYPNGLRHAADEHPNHHKSEIVDGTRISFSKRKFS